MIYSIEALILLKKFWYMFYKHLLYCGTYLLMDSFIEIQQSVIEVKRISTKIDSSSRDYYSIGITCLKFKMPCGKLDPHLKEQLNRLI